MLSVAFPDALAASLLEQVAPISACNMEIKPFLADVLQGACDHTDTRLPLRA